MNKTTELFCLIDDFCQQFEPLLKPRLLDEGGDQRRRNRECVMALSEMTTIVVLFHTMRGRQFKEFYRGTLCRFMTSEFPRRLFPHPLRGLDAALCGGAGCLVRDAQRRLHGLVDCRRYAAGRLSQPAHRAPQGFQGPCPARQIVHRKFYGFKLHAVINHRGELLAIASNLFGTLYADKGYIGKEFAQKMKDKGIDVVTRVRKNMKEVMHSEFDRVLLRKRSLVETVFDALKNLCQIEHTRHRSPMNFTVHLMAGIVAYCLQPVKPRIAVWDSRDPLAVN